MSRTVLLAGLLLALSPAAQALTPAWRVIEQASRAPLQAPAAEQAVLVEINRSGLAQAPEQLMLPFGGLQHAVWRVDFQRHADGRESWFGRFGDSGEQSVVLSRVGDAIAGFIADVDANWELVPTGEPGRSLLLKVDPSRLPPCLGPVPAPTSLLPGFARGAAVASDSGERVDVLVMYSPAARDAAGSDNAIRAQAQAAVDSANTVFANSGMRMRFNAVGIELLADWVDTSEVTASTQLGQFRSNATMQARRNALAADMVSLLVQTLPSACGIGYVMRSVGPGFASSAVQITARGCAVGNLSWAHEHGHNMGFEHDPANGTTPQNASRPWSFGHYVEGQGSQSFRTVMSYACPAGGCTRRPYFSSPRVRFNGFATGIDGERDNARTGDEVADIVANFRVAPVWPGFADGFEAR